MSASASNLRNRRSAGSNLAALHAAKTATPNFELEGALQSAEGDPYQLDKRNQPFQKQSSIVAHGHKELRDWAVKPNIGATERDDDGRMMVTGIGPRSGNYVSGGSLPFRTSGGMPAPRVRPATKKAVTAFKRDTPKELTLHSNQLSQLTNDQAAGSAGIRDSDQPSTLRRHESTAQLRPKEDVSIFDMRQAKARSSTLAAEPIDDAPEAQAASGQPHSSSLNLPEKSTLTQKEAEDYA